MGRLPLRTFHLRANFAPKSSLDMLQRIAPLPSPSLRQVARTLVAAGVEIFAERESELHIAERVRMHLMDSGVRVRVNDARIEIVITATAARSEHPSAESHELFDQVRRTIGADAIARGYRELEATTSDAVDPHNPKRILDVFYGLGYVMRLNDPARLVEEVRWALELEKSLASA
jgi:hypothetical protein